LEELGLGDVADELARYGQVVEGQEAAGISR
jgi:hypothetical protein